MNAGKQFKYVATTPRQITDQIREFSSAIVSGAEPELVFLEVTPASFSAPGQCYQNARLVAEQLGGEVVHGWLIWELPGAYLTAEHHAIVESNGQLIDVTPAIAGERKVLFLADRHSTGTTPRPVNKYVPLSRIPMMKRYCQLARRNSQLELEGKAFGPEYQRNDAEMTRCLDTFFRQQHERESQKKARKKKKEKRRRRKRSR